LPEATTWESPVKNIKILTHIDFYKTFFDHTWSRRLDELVAGTKLVGPVFSLCMYWKAAANTHIMPWLMVESLKGFSDGYGSGGRSAADRAVWHMVRAVPAAMTPHMTNMGRKKLTEVMDDLGEKWKTAQGLEAEELDSQAMFEQFLYGPGGSELQLSIWGTQRIVYGSLFHAYENFVNQTVGLARSEPNYKGFPFDKLVADAKTVFGDSTAKYCLTDPFVKASRLVRNALAHNGGRVDEKLAGVDHGIEVVDGELQVMPPDNRKLLNELKVRVLKLAETAVALPTVQQAVAPV
jgi:hypothetical protein